MMKDFRVLSEAKEWIFGPEAQKQRSSPGGMVALIEKARESTAELSAAQIAEAAAAFRTLDGQGTLTEAVDFFLKHARPSGGVKTFSELSEFYIGLKETKGTSKKHRSGLRTVATHFSGDYGNSAVNTIRQETIEEWLKELDLEPVTVGNYIRDLRSMFREAVRRQWCVSNPLENIQKPVGQEEEIQCLAPADVARLFVHCPPELQPMLALKIFAGLRTAELLRLDWNQVGREEIVIWAKQAKTRRRRPVTVQPNLSRWFSKMDRGDGLIWKKGQNAYHDAVNRLAVAAGVELAPNRFRQTFASYHYAKFKNENLTAAEMGNSPKVIFAAYRAVAKKEDAKTFWSITPETAEALTGNGSADECNRTN